MYQLNIQESLQGTFYLKKKINVREIILFSTRQES